MEHSEGGTAAKALLRLAGFAAVALFLLSNAAAVEPRAAVDIAPWYPKGNDYVFICKLTDFNATVYDWDFGDGQKLYDVKNNNVFHRYLSNGTYDVTCDGENAQGEVVGFRQVTVGTSTPPPPPSSNNTSASVSIAPWYPKGRDYVFVCNASGFAPADYDWDFGDGQKLYDMKSNNVYHRFAANGTYAVNCEAEAPGKHADAWKTVIVQ